MSTKTCPHCNADDIPVEAYRCKHCFHDFKEAGKSKMNAIVAIFAVMAVMSLIGMGLARWSYQNTSAARSVIDGDTRSIVITKKSVANTEALRISFDQVQKVEYVIGASGVLFELAIYTTEGKRYVINASDDKALDAEAEQLSRMTKKPLDRVEVVKNPHDNAPPPPTP